VHCNIKMQFTEDEDRNLSISLLGELLHCRVSSIGYRLQELHLGHRERCTSRRSPPWASATCCGRVADSRRYRRASTGSLPARWFPTLVAKNTNFDDAKLVVPAADLDSRTSQARDEGPDEGTEQQNRSEIRLDGVQRRRKVDPRRGSKTKQPFILK